MALKMNFEQDDIDAAVTEISEESDLSEEEVALLISDFLEKLRLRLGIAHPFTDVALTLESYL